MKKITAIILALVCIVSFASCSKNNSPAEPSSDGVTAASADSGQVSSRSGFSEHISVPAVYPLYESDKVNISIVSFSDPETSKNRFSITADFAADQDEIGSLQISDATVNEKLILPNTSLTNGSGCVRDYDEVGVYAEAQGGWQEIKSFSCTVKAMDGEYKEVFTEQLETEFPDGLYPEIVTLPAFGITAEKQTLTENDNVKAELLSLGKHAPAGSNRIEGEVLFENKSDRVIPVCVHGVVLDGVFFSSAKQYTYLEAGQKGLIPFCFYPDKMLGITTASSAELVISTSPSEILDSMSVQGGTAYPVNLSQSGDAAAALESGTTVFENDDLKIEQLKNDQSSSVGKFKVINKSTRSLLFTTLRQLDKGAFEKHNYYCPDSYVPSGAAIITCFSVLGSEDVPANGTKVSKRLHISGSDTSYASEEFDFVLDIVN